ncbi:poly-gamma-glutamate synthesis protein (capsule biosynthesis protein) [Halorhabdus tiamatea SARL4B]|uniref:Poly-gamma-glutamate synthesis protein (Capsule biosynthesis protein) n=1 Tax=Halorhabdus tiamatea SARL4B TaxID=1033806 RepID=S6CUJ0_9EURY|nr:poly-gamma-glutamate synthesis protein (capsule biosynthesis protein) [Halorhabdus tiamatea SARL4B]
MAAVAGTAGCLGAPSRRSRGGLDAGSADARIGFVGDVMLGRGVNDRWTDADPAGVWGTTLERLRSLDGLVANLESCVSDGGERWPGKTYYFRADPEFAVPALETADVSVAALANNHVLDFGESGLQETLANLDEAGVAHTGAGPNRDTALEPAVFDAGGLTVAVISLTDRWAAYAAGEHSPGTAYTPLDRSEGATRALVRNTLDRANAADPDLVVASLHWGPNWEAFPSASQQRFARWLVRHGVDVVHGHSAHVLQGVEVYQGRPIIYDAGDFVDDYIHKDGLQNKRSALFELVVTDGRLDELRLVPVEIENRAVSLADADISRWVHETMAERSEPFGTGVERTDDGVVVPLGSC